MEIKIMEEKTEIIFKNNSIFIGIYLVSLITVISLAISKISVQSIIFHLIFFTFLSIGNYIAMRNIGSIETITLKNESLIVRRLKKNKKITYEKEIFFGEIVKVYYQENFLEKFDINKDLKETTESILQIYMKNENIKDYVEFEDRISEITSVVRKSTDIIMEKILDENSDKALKTIICNNIKQLGLTSDNNNYFERSDRTYYAPVEFDINTDNGLSEAKQLLKSKSEEIVDIHLNKIYKEICNDEELEKFIKKEVSHIGEKYFNFQNDVYALCREEKEEEIKFGRNREINFYKDKESFKRQIEFIIGFNLEDKRIESLQNYYNEKHNIKDMEQHKNELMSYNQKEVVNEKETNKHILVEEKDFGYCGDF